MKKKECSLLYVDGLNFMHEFMAMGTNHWDNINQIQKNVEFFVQSLSAQNYSIKVFIDAGYSTPETFKKF